METTKKKKSIFKKWWFWLIIALVIVIIVASSSGNDENSADNNSPVKTTQETTETITYEKVDLQTMIDELDSNALKAEKTYQDKYLEFTGKIADFDSDGTYVTIEPTNADEWNFNTIMCYIKDEKQEEFLLEKSVGDEVTVKGKITSVGEVLGYSLDIDSVE